MNRLSSCEGMRARKKRVVIARHVGTEWKTTMITSALPAVGGRSADVRPAPHMMKDLFLS
jgi:hypothetical protein